MIQTFNFRVLDMTWSILKVCARSKVIIFPSCSLWNLVIITPLSYSCIWAADWPGTWHVTSGANATARRPPLWTGKNKKYFSLQNHDTSPFGSLLNRHIKILKKLFNNAQCTLIWRYNIMYGLFVFILAEINHL